MMPHEEIPMLPGACGGVRVDMRAVHAHASYSGAGCSQSSSCTGGKSSGELRTLTLAICLTSVFFIIELVGGYLARSLAIMSDAAHLLSDLAGLLISLVAVSVARIPASALMSFGFVRAEVLGAFVSLLVIWSLTTVLVVCAVQRLFAPAPVNGPLMLALGVIALAVNIVLAFVLGHSHGHDHGHDHGHAHGHVHAHSHFHHHPTHSHHHADEECASAASSTSRSWRDIFFGDDIASVNIRAAYLHVLGDLLQSIGVIIAALAITFFPALKFIDPLCTLFFAGLVFMTTRGLARETLGVLMEGSPSHISLSAVHHVLKSIKGVAHVGDFHVWSITARRPALSVHLYKDKMAHEHVLLKEAQAVLKERFGITHATIQINCKEAQCCDENGLREGHDKCLSTKDLASLPL